MPTNPAEGGDCYPGTYCPGASAAPINCTGGYYCATSRLATPTDLCNQGQDNILHSSSKPLTLQHRDSLIRQNITFVDVRFRRIRSEGIEILLMAIDP